MLLVARQRLYGVKGWLLVKNQFACYMKFNIGPINWLTCVRFNSVLLHHLPYQPSSRLSGLVSDCTGISVKGLGLALACFSDVGRDGMDESMPLHGVSIVPVKDYAWPLQVKCKSWLLHHPLWFVRRCLKVRETARTLAESKSMPWRWINSHSFTTFS